MAGGDALNAVLVDLADPRIPATVREAAKVPLPEGAARTIPFQYATIGGTLALGRLDVGDAWPVALRYQALEGPRRAYQQAVARLLEQCRSHRLTPEAVEAVGAAAKDLGARADAAIPQSSPAYRQVARQFTGSLERSARALTQTTYVEDLLGELDGFRGATIGDLVDLMRRYNLHFGPTEAPEELGLYQALYPLLVGRRRALGLDGRVGAGVGRGGVTPPVAPDRPGTAGAVSIWSPRRRYLFERTGRLGRWSRQGSGSPHRTMSDDMRLASTSGSRSIAGLRSSSMSSWRATAASGHPCTDRS